MEKKAWLEAVVVERLTKISIITLILVISVVDSETRHISILEVHMTFSKNSSAQATFLTFLVRSEFNLTYYLSQLNNKKKLI